MILLLTLMNKFNTSFRTFMQHFNFNKPINVDNCLLKVRNWILWLQQHFIIFIYKKGKEIYQVSTTIGQTTTLIKPFL